MIDSRKIAVIALGSNLGDARTNVLSAMKRLEQFSATPLIKSSLWQTAPVDCPPGSPPFINAVVLLVPKIAETPESLLASLQALEKEFGRRPKKQQNEPRPLDLDMIVYRDQARRSADLILPHPRAHQRRFVLEPLSEIAPGLLFPGQKQTVRELLAGLPEDSSMRRVSNRPE